MSKLFYNIESDLDPQYMRMKKRIKKSEKKINRLSFLLKLSLAANILLIAFGVCQTFRLSGTQIEMSHVQEENEKLKEENKSLSVTVNVLSDICKKVSGIAVDMDNNISKLKETIADQENTIEDLGNDLQLVDDYRWTLYYGGRRTDLDVTQLANLQKKIYEAGYDKNMMDFILSIAMLESHGDSKAENPASTATGYGQFLSGTGRWVYESLMGQSGYNHSVTPKDEETNLEMMLQYLSYLDDKYNGSITSIINEYGTGEADYLIKLNRWLANTDHSVYDLKI